MLFNYTYFLIQPMLKGWGLNLSPALVDLIAQMLALPDRRISLRDVLEHPWMKE